MIPIIKKLKKSDCDYKWGFRWIVISKRYTVKVRTIKNALNIWKREVKRSIPSWFFIEHDFYFDKDINEEYN